MASTGSITTDVAASYMDNDTITLDDGVHPALTFEYYVSGSYTPTVGDLPINISAATTANDVAVATFNAITAATGAMFTIAAPPPGATAVIALSNRAGYNSTIMVTGTGNMVTGMAGGASFALTAPGNIHVSISSGSIKSAQDVCTALWTAMHGTIPDGPSPPLSSGTATVL